VEPGLDEGLVATDQRVLPARIEATRLFRGDQTFHIEVLYLAGETGGHGGGVEASDVRNTGGPSDQLVVVRLGVVPEDGAHAKTGDDHALLGIRGVEGQHANGGRARSGGPVRGGDGGGTIGPLTTDPPKVLGRDKRTCT
jgi:hypothetical protein